MAGTFNPQPKTKRPKKKKPNRSPYRNLTIELDGHCRACGVTTTRLAAHHIIYLSQGGQDITENGITLCTTCHKDVHDGIVFKGTRLSGRDFMLAILERYKSDPCWRWDEAYEHLRRKV